MSSLEELIPIKQSHRTQIFVAMHSPDHQHSPIPSRVTDRLIFVLKVVEGTFYPIAHLIVLSDAADIVDLLGWNLCLPFFDVLLIVCDSLVGVREC